MITSEMKDRRQWPAFRDGDSRRLNKSNGAASERAGGRDPRSKGDGKRTTGGSGKKGHNADDPPTIGIRDQGLCLPEERYRRGGTESEFIAASPADRSCKRAPLCVRATRKTAAHADIDLSSRVARSDRL